MSESFNWFEIFPKARYATDVIFNNLSDLWDLFKKIRCISTEGLIYIVWKLRFPYFYLEWQLVVVISIMILWWTSRFSNQTNPGIKMRQKKLAEGTDNI